ncbi:hypothetical protein [Sphingomonas abietis]|uniref:Diguanylate cyclase n=1 Tax=Sphingomonas abietis TaxID=3012344 RepID=A0ABY7NJG7_9SPHN|nr:hypothetical protein [Sphingomonas abietis]WBO21619.1 hypothetical protein PBT88_15755 [Sphingomonas abietis]
MRPTQPLELHHSWPLFERGQRFDLGYVHAAGAPLRAAPTGERVPAWPGVGLWECDLRDNALTWSDGVYALFELPRDTSLSRAETAAMYGEDSRAAMERLRAYAIKHRRGFTLDAEIRPADGGRRWMRLTAAPICIDGRVVRLHGLKQDISHEYP